MHYRTLSSTVKFSLPALYQASVFASIPLLFTINPLLVCVAMSLGILYHYIGISVTGHMIISHQHGKDLQPALYTLLHLFFFYCTLITPQLWAGYHIQHHKHHDTKLDPQARKILGWRVLIATWNPDLVDIRTYLKTNKIPICKFIAKHYYLLILLLVGVCLLLPLTVSLVFILIPFPLALWLGTLSAYTTHYHGKPSKKLAMIERILYLGEITEHEYHHKNDCTKLSNTQKIIL